MRRSGERWGQICTQGCLRGLAVALSCVLSRGSSTLVAWEKGTVWRVSCREDISLLALEARCGETGLGVGPGRQGV